MAAGSPAAFAAPFENVPDTRGCGANWAGARVEGGAPAPRAAAISLGGAPKVGLPTRATDRTLGLGWKFRGAAEFVPAAGATGDGGGAANFGGRDVGGRDRVEPGTAGGRA